MKLRSYISALLVGTLLLFSSCVKLLKEDVYSQLDPETSFKSVNGIEKVLFSAYNLPEFLGEGSYSLMLEECTSDQLFVTGGEFGLDATIMKNFSFDAFIVSFLLIAAPPPIDAVLKTLGALSIANFAIAASNDWPNVLFAIFKVVKLFFSQKTSSKEDHVHFE